MSQPRIEGYRGPRPCETCGVSFTPKISTPRQGLGIYCSRSCAGGKLRNTIDSAFWANVQKTSACWIWTGRISKAGYGYLSLGGESFFAHRLSFRIAHGEPGQGLHVCHTCDVRACVNPAHLYAGTAKQNSSDAVERDRIAHGERAGPARLTAAQVTEIRDRFASGTSSIASMAKEFGVSGNSIGNVVHRKTWRRVA